MARAQLMMEVMMSVEVGSATPVYGNHNEPDSDVATMRDSSNQNLRFVGGLSVGGKPAASRVFLRRRCKMKTGMKETIAKIGALHSHTSEKPSGLRKMPISRKSDPKSDKTISIFDGFMRSNI
jgi:hypothetical protein